MTAELELAICRLVLLATRTDAIVSANHQNMKDWWLVEKYVKAEQKRDR